MQHEFLTFKWIRQTKSESKIYIIAYLILRIVNRFLKLKCVAKLLFSKYLQAQKLNNSTCVKILF